MNLPLSPGTIPGGFCPSTWQDVLNEFAANMSVAFNVSSGVTVVISSSKPSDTTVVWKRIDSLGRYQGDYIYGQGAWLRLHPIQPNATVWYFQALPDFTTYDGGDGLALGVQSGPMWQQAKDVNGNVIAAKFLLAAGTLPSGTIVANGATGGEEKHTLLIAEMASHTHQIKADATDAPSNGHGIIAGANGLTGPFTYDDTTYTSDHLSISKVGSDTPHNTMPLYVTGFLLQRTNRLYYAVN